MHKDTLCQRLGKSVGYGSSALVLAVVLSFSFVTGSSFAHAHTNASQASASDCSGTGATSTGGSGNYTVYDDFNYNYCPAAGTVTFDGWQVSETNDTNNVDSIYSSTSIEADGVGNFSFTTPSSASFSLQASNIAVHSQTVTNTWIGQFSYSGLQLTGIGAYWSFHQHDTSVFTLGGSPVQVGANVDL